MKSNYLNRKRNYTQYNDIYKKRKKASEIPEVFDTKAEYKSLVAKNQFNECNLSGEDLFKLRTTIFGFANFTRSLKLDILEKYKDYKNYFKERIHPEISTASDFIPENCKYLLLVKKEVLLKILNDNKKEHLSINKIYEIYKQQDPLFPGKSCTIKSYMIKVLRYAFKTPKIQTTRILNTDHLNMKGLFLKKLTEILEDHSIIIYIDESSFNNQHKKFKNWCSIFNSEPIKFRGRIRTINLMYSLFTDGNYFANFSINSNNGREYKSFLDYIISNIKNKKEYKHLIEDNKVWIYHDNASMHKTKGNIKYLKDNKINVLFPPPYCAQFNPCEFIFGYMKKKFYRRIFDKR